MIFSAGPPAAGTRQVSNWPFRMEPYMIESPPGDHTGQESAAGSLVRCRRSDPSTFCTHTSEFPVAFDANATYAPSGERAECMTASPGTLVICLACAALSSGWIHKLRLPPRALLKSNVRPSRDTYVHIGSRDESSRRTALRPFASGSGPNGTFHC